MRFIQNIFICKNSLLYSHPSNIIYCMSITIIIVIKLTWPKLHPWSSNTLYFINLCILTSIICYCLRNSNWCSDKTRWENSCRPYIRWCSRNSGPDIHLSKKWIYAWINCNPPKGFCGMSPITSIFWSLLLTYSSCKIWNTRGTHSRYYRTTSVCRLNRCKHIRYLRKRFSIACCNWSSDRIKWFISRKYSSFHSIYTTRLSCVHYYISYCFNPVSITISCVWCLRITESHLRCSTRQISRFKYKSLSRIIMSIATTNYNWSSIWASCKSNSRPSSISRCWNTSSLSPHIIENNWSTRCF